MTGPVPTKTPPDFLAAEFLVVLEAARNHMAAQGYSDDVRWHPLYDLLCDAVAELQETAQL